VRGFAAATAAISAFSSRQVQVRTIGALGRLVAGEHNGHLGALRRRDRRVDLGCHVNDRELRWLVVGNREPSRAEGVHVSSREMHGSRVSSRA